jgi:hypothetical protein
MLLIVFRRRRLSRLDAKGLHWESWPICMSFGGKWFGALVASRLTLSKQIFHAAPKRRRKFFDAASSALAGCLPGFLSNRERSLARGLADC